MPIEIGKTRCAEDAETARRTTRADSVAYATDESGSEAKIGSASHFGSSVSWSWPVCIGRPTSTRRRRLGSRDRSSGRVTALTFLTLGPPGSAGGQDSAGRPQEVLTTAGRAPQARG